MPRSKQNELIHLIHRGPEEIDQDTINLFMVSDPGEEDPVEDTYEIKDDEPSTDE